MVTGQISFRPCSSNTLKRKKVRSMENSEYTISYSVVLGNNNDKKDIAHALQASCPGSNPGVRTSSVFLQKKLNDYLGLLLLERKNKYWFNRVTVWLRDFVSAVDPENIAQVTKYLQKLQEKYHPNTYRKIYFQIRRFLRDGLNLCYLNTVRLPRVDNPPVKIITSEDIKQTLDYFSNLKYYLKNRAFVLLMSSSGLRPSEGFQLTREDIDLENRKIYVRVDATHHTKTGKSRIAFFDKKTQFALQRYLRYNNSKKLFNQSLLARTFGKSPVKIKEFRKFFSQEATRRNMNQFAKEKILGHSLGGNVDAMHYCNLTESELHRIYDETFKN